MNYRAFILITLFWTIFCCIGSTPSQAQMNVLRAQTRVIQRAIQKNIELSFKPKLVIREGATGPVTALALSDDEHFLITGVGNNTVRIWDLFVGREIAQLKGHTGRITAVAVASDGSQAATVGEDRTVRLWDMKKIGAVQVLEGHKATLTGVAFVTGGKRLATSDADGEIRVWDAKTGALIKAFQGHSNSIKAIAASPDGSRLVSTDEDGMVRVWDMDSVSQIMEIQAPASLRSLAVGMEGRVIVGGDVNGSIQMWDAGKGTELGSFSGHDGPVSSVKLDENSHTIISGGVDKTVRVWDTTRKSEPRVLGSHDGAVTFVALARDGSFALSASEDGFTRLWNVSTGAQLISLISTETGWAVVDPKGRYEGNQRALAGIDWQASDAALPVDSFSEAYYEPALLPRAMKGETSLAAVRSIPDGVNYPPTVKIVSPTENAGGGERSVSVELLAESKQGGVADVRLYRNGKLVSDPGVARIKKEVTSDGSVSLTKTYDITLSPGQNHLSATAINDERTESKPETLNIAAPGIAPSGKLHIVIVGINVYKNQNLNLNYARPDADGIKKFFSSPSSVFMPVANIDERLDGEATKKNILEILHSLRNVPAEDAVLIYMAGHGVGADKEWYFIPHEIDVPKKPEDLAGIALSSSELKAEIEALGANRTFLLLDACHSGTAVAPLRDYKGMKALRLLARAVGTHVLAATDRAQFAVEVDKLGHGIFTYTILKALEGKSKGGPAGGQVTARDIIRYVEDQVPKLSQEYADYGQYPTGYSRGEDFGLAVRK